MIRLDSLARRLSLDFASTNNDQAEHEYYIEASPKEHLDLDDRHERRSQPIKSHLEVNLGTDLELLICCNQSQIERKFKKREDYLIK